MFRSKISLVLKITKNKLNKKNKQTKKAKEILFHQPFLTKHFFPAKTFVLNCLLRPLCFAILFQ